MIYQCAVHIAVERLAIERCRQKKGPLPKERPREIIVLSGVQCLPPRSQMRSRRVPDASLSDHDIVRLKIPLDIGSPPLGC